MSALLSHRATMSVLLPFILPALWAQSQPDTSKFTLHAAITKQPNGDLRIVASSPRPLYQAISALSFQYGLVTDYEDPWYQNDQMYVDADGREQLVGGQFTAVISQITDRNTELTALQQLVSQFNAKDGVQFTLIQHRDGRRFDVVGETGAEKPLFDTPIYLEKRSRSAQEAIDEITRQIGQERGTAIVQGGLVNNALAQTKVTVGGPERKPAREFLTEVVDALPSESVWGLSYEPSWGKFVLAIRSRTSVITKVSPYQGRASGELAARAIPN